MPEENNQKKEDRGKIEIILQTELCHSKQEVDFTNNFGITEIKGSHIFVIEPCRKKERRQLTENVAEIVQNEATDLKTRYKDKIVLALVQFKKGITKTKEQVKMAMKCSLYDGSDGACLYETNPLQNLKKLTEEVSEFLEMTKKHEKYFVIEMDGEDVLEKVNFLLSKGIKNFILIAGDYKNQELWRRVIVSSILRENGEAMVLLPKRMHPVTKKSYIEMMVDFGATIVVHGMAFGGGENTGNKFLDSIDMFYKNKLDLPKTHSLIANTTFSDLADVYERNPQKEYELSRVCSLSEGRIFCDANRRTIIIET